MATYVSQETDEHAPIVCYFCANARGTIIWEGEGKVNVAAVALRGQWEGGDNDVDPIWRPVCFHHDALWNTSEDPPLKEEYLLPRFELPTWWVVIDRPKTESFFPKGDMAIGPYPDEESAIHAMENAILIEGELQDPGGYDCTVEAMIGVRQYEDDTLMVDAFDLALVHLDDPGYTGKEK